MDAQARIFLDAFESALHALGIGLNTCAWNFYTRGEKGDLEHYEAVQAELLREPFLAARLARWRGKLRDPVVARRAQLLAEAAEVARVDGLPALFRQVNALSEIHIRFRARFEGRPATDNALRHVLEFSPDRSRRREAWRARAQVGARMARPLAVLVRARNREARRLGAPDFHRLRLRQNHLEPAFLEPVVSRLERASERPYAALLDRLRRSLGVARIAPWDLAFDPNRNQERLLPYLGKSALLERLRGSYAAMGFALERMPITVDADERPGKSQHAYCFTIDPPADVRVLANADDGLRAYDTLFHEFGHAVHAASIDQPSYLLCDAPSGCFSEGVANFFGDVPHQGAWLVRHAGAPADLVERYLRARRDRELVALRGRILQIRFEAALYAGRGDPTARYWSLAERLLGVEPPRGVASWAGTIHFTTHPAYLPNYLVADLIAAQLRARLAREGGVTDNRAVAPFLVEAIFRHGARYRWQELLRRATGRPFDVAPFVRERLGHRRPAGRLAERG